VGCGDAAKGSQKLQARKAAWANRASKRTIEGAFEVFVMLGSSEDGEVLAGVRKAEANRAELGLPWETIIMGNAASVD
jgi:hypothetical protein